MSIDENSESFELIVKYGLHVKPSENSDSGKKFASVGYAVTESQMEYVHEELPGNYLEDKIAYRTAIFRAALAVDMLRGLLDMEDRRNKELTATSNDASDERARDAVIIKLSDQKPESMEWKPIKGIP